MRARVPRVTARFGRAVISRRLDEIFMPARVRIPSSSGTAGLTSRVHGHGELPARSIARRAMVIGAGTVPAAALLLQGLTSVQVDGEGGEDCDQSD